MDYIIELSSQLQNVKQAHQKVKKKRDEKTPEQIQLEKKNQWQNFNLFGGKYQPFDDDA